MKKIKKIILGLVLSSASFSGYSQKQDTYQQRLSLLNEKISTVTSALANAQGFQKKSGAIDLQTATFFSEYIAWEIKHPEITKDALMGNEAIVVRGASASAVKTGANIDSLEREKRYHRLIDFELTSSMEILNQALIRLKKNAKWPIVEDIKWSQMQLDNGYFRVNGRPVFSGGFNVIDHSLVDADKYPEWKEKDKTLLPIFLKEMQGLGVGIINMRINIPNLIQKDGSIDVASIKTFTDKIKQYDQMGFKVDVRLGWSGKNEILEKFWPNITDYKAHGVPFDIDHPGVQIMVPKVIKVFMKELQKQPAILSWDLANEPGFYLHMWSKHSLKKYQAWLTKQHITIAQLNKAWKSNYESFETIPLPKAKKPNQCAAGEWYDIVTFQSYRVKKFFELAQQNIRKYLPNATIHMKAQDNSSLGPRPNAVTDGIDREMLTPLLSLQGVDTRPLPVTEPRMAASNYDASIYGLHWLGQSFLYDYLTSLEPQHSIVDFEYHAFSINGIRVPEMAQNHSKVSLWLAHLHGQISNITWYWHRRYGPNPFPHEKASLWFYGNISTQPLAATEYFQTMLRLNTFAEEVEALATDPIGPVRILVSKPSFVQNQAHIDALHRVYEGTCFSGKRIGFVTEQMLEVSGIPKGCKMIIIPDAEYVNESTLQTLKESLQQGVKLLIFGDITTKFNAHGLPHEPSKLAFLKDVPVYNYASAPELSSTFKSLLATYTEDLPIKITVLNSKDAFGIINRQVEVNGKKMVLLINVANKPVQVQLESKDGKFLDGYDTLNGEEVKGNAINMSFEGVRLINVTL